MRWFLAILSLGLAQLVSNCASKSANHEAIEYLVFQVDPARVEAFIQLDHEIWTKALMTYDGFVDKEVWVNESRPGEVTLLIHWRSKAEWKSIPEEELLDIVREFDSAFAGDYRIIQELHSHNDLFRVKYTAK